MYHYIRMGRLMGNMVGEAHFLCDPLQILQFLGWRWEMVYSEKLDWSPATIAISHLQSKGGHTRKFLNGPHTPDYILNVC